MVVVDPVRDSIDSALLHREPEYTSQTSYSIFVGTFNVNGKVPGSESLLPWLFPDPNFEPDIIALGFQELVELSPQQIVRTSFDTAGPATNKKLVDGNGSGENAPVAGPHQ